MQVPQCGAGFGAQFVDQPVAQPPVVGQGVGGASGAVQGQHELSRHVLVQRPLRGAGGQRGHQVLTVPEAQPDVGQVALGGQVLVVQPVSFDRGPVPRDSGQRLSTPQFQRLLEQPHRLPVVTGAGADAQLAEPEQVDRGALDVQRVATGTPGDDRLPGVGVRVHEQEAQARQVVQQRRPGPLWRAVSPNPLYQPIHRNHPARVHRQRGQHATLPSRPQIQGTALDQHLYPTQKNEFHLSVPQSRVPARDVPANGDTSTEQAIVGKRGRFTRTAAHSGDTP